MQPDTRTPDELHRQTWRRGDGTRVNIADMNSGEIENTIVTIEQRIAKLQKDMFDDPKYEALPMQTRANTLIRNSQEKIQFFREELDKRAAQE